MNKTILSTLVVAMLMVFSGFAYAQNDQVTGTTVGVQTVQSEDMMSYYPNLDALKIKEATYAAMSVKEIIAALDVFLKGDVQPADYEELLGNSKCKGLIGTALNKAYELAKKESASPSYDVILEKAGTLLFFLNEKNLKSDKRVERVTALSTELIELSKQEKDLKRAYYYEQAANYANINVSENASFDFNMIREAVLQKILQKTTVGVIELDLMFNEYLNIPMKIIANYIQDENPYNFIKVLVLRKYLEIASSLVNEVATKDLKTYTFDERFAERSFFEQGNLSEIDKSVAGRLGEDISDESASRLDLFKKLTNKITEDVMSKSWVKEAYGEKWKLQRDVIKDMELKPCW